MESTVSLYLQQNDSILDVPASRFIWQGRLIKGGDYDDDDNKNDDMTMTMMLMITMMMTKIKT